MKYVFRKKTEKDSVLKVNNNIDENKTNSQIDTKLDELILIYKNMHTQLLDYHNEAVNQSSLIPYLSSLSNLIIQYSNNKKFIKANNIIINNPEMMHYIDYIKLLLKKLRHSNFMEMSSASFHMGDSYDNADNFFKSALIDEFFHKENKKFEIFESSFNNKQYPEHIITKFKMIFSSSDNEYKFRDKFNLADYKSLIKDDNGRSQLSRLFGNRRNVHLQDFNNLIDMINDYELQIINDFDHQSKIDNLIEKRIIELNFLQEQEDYLNMLTKIIENIYDDDRLLDMQFGAYFYSFHQSQYYTIRENFDKNHSILSENALIIYVKQLFSDYQNQLPSSLMTCNIPSITWTPEINEKSNILNQEYQEKFKLLEKAIHNKRLMGAMLELLSKFDEGIQVYLPRLVELSNFKDQTENILKMTLSKYPNLGSYNELAQIFIPSSKFGDEIDKLINDMNQDKDKM